MHCPKNDLNLRILYSVHTGRSRRIQRYVCLPQIQCYLCICSILDRLGFLGRDSDLFLGQCGKCHHLLLKSYTSCNWSRVWGCNLRKGCQVPNVEKLTLFGPSQAEMCFVTPNHVQNLFRNSLKCY